jgi:hypothetical protein
MSPFTLFLEDVKLFLKRVGTSENSSAMEFLGKLTLNLSQMPPEDEIDTIFKKQMQEA